MFYVYVLKSTKSEFHYTGMTNCIDRRLNQHNAGQCQATKHYAPFELVYTEKCLDRESARKLEKKFKSGSGREFIQKLEKSKM